MYCLKIWRDCKFFDYCQWKKTILYRNRNNFFYYKDRVSRLSLEEENLFNLWLKSIFKYEWVLLKDLSYFLSNLKFNRNFHVGVYSILEEKTYYKNYLTSESYVSVFISENKSIINKYIYYDTNPNYKIRILWTWKILWYPDCCVKNALIQCKNIKTMNSFENNNWINRFECPLVFWPIRLYAHFACSDKCISTIELSEKVLFKLWEKHWESVIKDFFFINKSSLYE